MEDDLGAGLLDAAAKRLRVAHVGHAMVDLLINREIPEQARAGLRSKCVAMDAGAELRQPECQP